MSKNYGKIMACIILLGIGILSKYKTDNKVIAAPVAQQSYILPVDFQLSLLKSKIKDLESKQKIPDTVKVQEVKYKKVRVPHYITKRDTLYVPLLFIATHEVREEKPLRTESCRIDSCKSLNTSINSCEDSIR